MITITNHDLAIAMRHMAWERAKGELRSTLHTYWTEYDTQGNPIDNDNGFDLMNKKIEAFIKDFENHFL